ncbi:MAG TPA: electron transfer flavoprotein-ubiquinone oxidoreductase, partial [Bauldia sp.]|nr:electron transfer flavoprotein-ubiquinone oxidoreductase [Bauldia sp.]
VVVLEKGSEVGAHILSGAVMDPVGLTRLIPDWKEKGAPLETQVTQDVFLYLGPAGEMRLPAMMMPPLMNNHGNYIGSLGLLTRWLGEQAAALGVDIFPMTAAVDVLTGPEGEVRGIITGDLGVGRDGKPKSTFARGIALEAKYTLIGEGARGSLAKSLIRSFNLDANASPQKYGLGIKEIWEVSDSVHEPGRIDHYLGFPLDDATGGGGFAYHAADRKVYLGLVVHLDYKNPTLSPFAEFQRFKQHPAIARLLTGARRISYGARAMTSGGLQSIPELTFPGGALIGCAAGYMNVPALKAIHNAILSGITAADSVGAAIAAGRQHDKLDLAVHPDTAKELRSVRNTKPLWSRFGTLLGVGLAGLDLWSNALFGGSPFGTLRHRRADHATLRDQSIVHHKVYDRPDGTTTFDRPSSVFLANLAHDEDQPVHLVLKDPAVPIRDNLPRYGEPAPLYCPAGVYEVARAGDGPVFRIHPANCVHCKTCDIKDPAQNVTWVPPEGGSGPNYSGM